MTNERITLVGDGIENPWNAQTLIDAAGMFGGDCLFRDRGELANAWQTTFPAAGSLALTSHEELVHTYAPIIAFDNLNGASAVYGFRMARGGRPAVVVGNERHGLARDMQIVAHHAVQIPLLSRNLNCLNVAAAAAVALYYLSRGGGGQLQSSIHPHKRRPELMMIGTGSHVELGSAIRSAGAFGWERLFVEDRAGVWFGCNRIVRSEGRAAARRGRNPIHVIPTTPDRSYSFGEVCVVTVTGKGTPLHQARLAAGPRQLIAIPDESCLDLSREDWSRLGKKVTFMHVDVPCRDFVYHYRLIATIILAEVARQVGRRLRDAVGRPTRHAPFYDHALDVLSKEQGETVFLEDLECY